MSASLQRLRAIMVRLRAVDGCPWDREQTFASIAPFTIEEAYEVADAIERNDMPHLQDELGDLLFQVVFHSQLAEEAGHFDFDAVAAAISDKLVRRHPHLFATTAVAGQAGALSVEQQTVLWENIKADERAAAARGAASALDGVPLTLPALMRAFKLSKRAARLGFDFERVAETADKVAEELAEVREAAAAQAAASRDAMPAARGDAGAAAPGAATDAMPTAAGASAHLFEEVGDLLFAAANLARKLDVDAESALRAANLKFERRFHGMERLAVARGLDFGALDLAAQEALWQEVKRAE